MNKLWSDRAWDDYLYWQTYDKKTVKKINELVKDIERNGLQEGIGHPEPLRYRKAWSRQLTMATGWYITLMKLVAYGLLAVRDIMRIERIIIQR